MLQRTLTSKRRPCPKVMERQDRHLLSAVRDGLVAVAVMAAMVAARLRDAIDPVNLALTYDTGHRAFKVTAATFKLDLVKGHLKAAWADLVGTPSAVKVDIAETDIARLLGNRPAAGTFGLALKLRTAVAITGISAIPIAITGIADPVRPGRIGDGAITGLDRNGGTRAFAMRLVSQGWRGEEQGRC